jgi:hypothetical protein
MEVRSAGAAGSGSSKNLEGLTGSVLSRRDLSIRMIIKVGYQRNLRLIFFVPFGLFVDTA